MKVAFIHQGGEQMASYRYRSAIPCAELVKLGHECHVNSGEADVVVFSKPMLNDYEIALDVKAQGAKVMVDIGDDHMTHEHLGPLYRKMIELSSKIICPTQNMAERIYRVCGLIAEIIPDPYEEEKQEAHANGDKLLWFGHLMNVKDLSPWRPCLNGIRVLTGPKPRIRQKEGKKLLGAQWDDSWLEWSREAQTKELSEANITIIPTRRGAEFKSPNRLLNSVRGGCFVVASHHPSHEEFRKMLWIGDIKAGLDWTRAFQDELSDRVKEAQAYVEKTYSPDVVAKRWEQVLA